MRPYSAVIFLASHLLVVTMMTGCQTATSKLAAKEKVNQPLSDIFDAKYEDVEMALKQALVLYPTRVDNTEAGIYETDFVKGAARFQAPNKSKDDFPSGFRYRILARLVRGANKNGHTAVKVVILKQAELARDFFATAEPLPSDGLEERVILYRIRRVLQIERAAKRAAKKASAAPPK